ncbi:MAG: hypothetical protein JG774_2070 [Desulfomicrobiaceae bacterium]|jgi:hypothetical protein|nr:hypothetical protein [Desulfomicrobiaceae bacterium]
MTYDNQGVVADACGLPPNDISKLIPYMDSGRSLD